MKWIGQNIYDQISRFRNDVHVTGDLTVTGDNIIFQSANADDPLVTIKNTSNAANDMARLNFVKERDSGTAAANDNCAEIRFLSKDASGNEQQYGLMLSEIDVATHGQESGRLKLGVASHDGENSYGLQITGGSVDNEVDVLLGTGDASETTITGTLTMGSTATIDNSGAWVGGVIPSAKLDADTAHLSVDNVFTGATQTITSDGGGRPAMVIQNTGNNADGGFLQFKLDKGAVGADDDRPGNIQWKSDNDAQQQSTFGTIYTLVSDATDGEEAGDMHLQVASYDGTLRSGLYLDGDTNAAGEVDVTIAAGAASITTIAGTLTMGSTAALTNAGLVAVANQSNITGLGTISSGVWNGTAIASAYLDTDTAHLSGTQSFTGTKTFDETISGAIDGNAATATILATTRAIGGVNFNGSAAIDLPGVNAAGNQSTSGLAATATLAADATTLATPRAINGVDFDGSAAITIPTNQIWGTYIKLLPTDFMPNDDGGTSKGITLNDSGTTGMKPGVAAMELVAIADIPEGFTATHVDIYDNSHDLAINVFEMNIGASGMAARGSGNANTTLDITDVESTVTNFLAIRVETTGTSERVFGGRITIAPN